jgi:hypothetical protein
VYGQNRQAFSHVSWRKKQERNNKLSRNSLNRIMYTMLCKIGSILCNAFFSGKGKLTLSSPASMLLQGPRDKLVCLLNCCRVINNILATNVKAEGTGKWHVTGLAYNQEGLHS